MKQGKLLAISRQQTLTPKKMTFPADLKPIPANRLASDGLLFAKSGMLGGKTPDTLKSKLTERDPRLLVNAKFNMSQKCALVEKKGLTGSQTALDKAWPADQR